MRIAENCGEGRSFLLTNIISRAVNFDLAKLDKGAR